MREYSTPPAKEIPSAGNLTDDVVANAAEHGSTVVFSRPAPAGSQGWVDVTAVQFHAQVRAVAKGLIAAGIEPGDRIALLSRTRYEWTLLDYAIWYAAAVGVPVYETSPPQEIRWVLSDSGARAIVVETAEHAVRLDVVRADLPGLEQLWVIDDGAIATLTALGRDVNDELLEERRTTAGPGDLATLVYTSGTTGPPKGCMLTHANFMVEIDVAVAALAELFESDDAATLLFLPLAHVFARVVQVGAVRSRTRLGHSADITNLVTDLQSFAPTFLLAVPRVFEKVFNTSSQRAAADGRGAVFDRAAETAIEYSRALDNGRVPLRLRAQHAVFSRLVYAPLRAALGGRCRYAVSGGAPLGERLGHFYRGIGVVVLEGYGLTETTAALSVNLPASVKIGSVGRPLPGTSVRVAENGELLFAGGQVFNGYWRNEEATAEVLTDGWLHTGDVGEVDDQGNVSITGRMNEIIVTAGGKFVSPAVLEDRMRAHPLVDQCLVVGDGRPFIAALITLDHVAAAAWARARDRSERPADLARDLDLRAEIEVAVEVANHSVSKAESIRRFQLLPGVWGEEGGQLTPSLKLRRNVVMGECKDEIAALYLS